MRTIARCRFPRKVLACLVTCAASIVGGSLQAAEGDDLGPLPAAKQIGVSCGFFANIPALTLATGVDIHASPTFVKSIYGLQRGEFEYRSSFDKRSFCELFSLPYVETRITHPPGSSQAILENTRLIITQMFNEGLANGRVYSLRVRGIFNGPHNTLLIGRRGGSYLLHDPFPGTIETVSLDQLANRMLVRSTTKENRGKVIYVTHFLTIELPQRPRGKVIPVNSLPTTLRVSLSARQRRRIATALQPAHETAPDDGIGGFIEAYPALNFAAVPGEGTNGKARNVVGKDVKAENLAGIVNLGKFTLNLWAQGRRPLLPVVVMDGRPHVLIGYGAPDRAHRATPQLLFDDGSNSLPLSEDVALDRIRKSGAMVATLTLERE